MLNEKRRINMQVSVNLLRRSLVDNDLKEMELTGDMAIYYAQLNHSYGDPAVSKLGLVGCKYLFMTLLMIGTRENGLPLLVLLSQHAILK